MSPLSPSTSDATAFTIIPFAILHETGKDNYETKMSRKQRAVKDAVLTSDSFLLHSAAGAGKSFVLRPVMCG